MMRIPLPLRLVRNSWAFYLLKHGLVRDAVLTVRSRPDPLTLRLDRDTMRARADHLKQLFKLMASSEFEYHASRNEMVVHAPGGKAGRRTFDLSFIPSVRYALEHDMVLEDTDDPQLCRVTPGKGAGRFDARKAHAADLQTIKAVCRDDEYGFLYPYLPGKLVVDVGANIGDTAVLFLQKGARAVEAFEVHPVLCALARRNLELNGLQARGRVVDRGISGLDGELRMREDSASGPTAGFGSGAGGRGREIVVNVVSMRSVIDRLGAIDILKMDCEGAEFDIFASLEAGDLRKIRVIGLEYHRDPGPIIRQLEGAGFRTRIVSSCGPLLGTLLAVREGA